MGNFFKSRSFFVLVTVLVLLCGIPTILSAMGQGSMVKDGVMAIVSPFSRGARALGEAFGGFGRYFSEFGRLEEENRILSDRVRELEAQVYDLTLLEEENAWMRAYLGAKRAHTDFTFCDANLIGSESGGHVSAFTLDRGTTSGIAVGMPVVTEDGVVGRVTEVGLTFSRVSTVINYDASIGAYIERSGEIGIVSGDFELRRDGLCLLEYLPFDADVEVGDTVTSSGLGSVYPRGLVIGEVTEITGDEYNHVKVAVVRPAADLTKLTKVMILTDYTVETEE